MTDHLCPRCGCALKVIQVQVPIKEHVKSTHTFQVTPYKLRYETREEISDCPRCTGSY